MSSWERISEVQDKYPHCSWWTPDFVESHPAVALLLQAVNDTTMLASHSALLDLSSRVAEHNETFISSETSPDVRLARLSLSALLQDDISELTLAYTILTPADKQELVTLMNGSSRVVVRPREG